MKKHALKKVFEEQIGIEQVLVSYLGTYVRHVQRVEVHNRGRFLVPAIKDVLSNNFLSNNVLSETVLSNDVWSKGILV
jgi:ribosomal protein L31E